MKNTWLFFIPVLFILNACHHDPLDIDLSDVKTTPLEVKRLERDLFSLDQQNFEQRHRALSRKYGNVYGHFMMNPLGLRGMEDTLSREAILAFINDRDVRKAYEYTQKIYSDEALGSVISELEFCRKRFRYHFPSRKLPSSFITCTTGWNYAFAYVDSSLILALDMYLGDTAHFYKMLRYPQYQTRRMNADHVLPDIARGWLLTEFDNTMAENTLLHHTIFYGKLYYAIEALLPSTHDSLIIGYTSRQMQMCERYEKQYWSYMAEKNRLYENSLQTIRELTSEGPFTAAISKESPPRLAMYIGWQIVRSYMKNNENVTIAQLMADQDAQKILNKSRYRP